MGTSDHLSRFDFGRTKLVAELDSMISSGVQDARVSDKVFPLVISDIEGCLNLDPLHYDFDILDRIRRLNLLASGHNPIPHLTLCTGRQSPFVDAFSAFLGVRMPVIFEGGSGLFYPLRAPGCDRVAWHPLVERSMESGELERIERVARRVARDECASASIGKERLQTYHARKGQDIERLTEIFRREMSDAGVEANITHSANAVDISVIGVDKGTAVSWLLSEISNCGYDGGAITADRVVVMGDAPNDFPLLRAAGRSVAPINAHHSVKQAVSYVSPYTDAKALAEELIRCIRTNMRLS
ncbi:HAD family hydrolase [Micromonospora chalcea]|uniref:HAD family hydrolase n=1 Tax=Micromonospora chalcea TaxID=1874 RepID=UPI0037B9BB1B